ncbi:SMP-30/gluconolactonase/LRE family protein [Afipia sp. GAS231]|uniref:SMP-30/gluconolactonase/LRE family protein n=1 Tax=Afipia sp. GAS231 TaxID=1882747 RepID=UPI001FCDD423|nr:SMP-30/gluconolactonase/LRE family protein [Afipia sp. GAS231]
MKVLLDGGRYFEGPRWHAGRLWFVDCFDRTLLSVGPAGDRQQHATFADDTPCGLGILPDGSVIVLTMFRKQLFRYADGQLSVYADLSQIAAGTIDDMIVDGLGRCYVGDLGFNLPPPAGRGAVGRIILVMPSGETRVVADGLNFPNGIAVSADNRRLVVAEMDGGGLADYEIGTDGGLRFHGRFATVQAPDGICLDQDQAVWIASYDEDAFIRVDREGRELQRIEVPGRRAIACALGGPVRRTLFCLSAATSHEEMRQRKSSARVDVIDVEVAGAGYP